MNDDKLKAMMQAAGFHNTTGPYTAAGTLENFRTFAGIVIVENKALPPDVVCAVVQNEKVAGVVK